MKLIHVFYASCGWSHGFSATRLPVEVVSGGLFAGPRRGPIREFGHVQAAKASIAEMTGTEFGEPYERLIADAVVTAFEGPEASSAAADDFRRAVEPDVTGLRALLAVDGDSVAPVALGHATAEGIDPRLASLRRP
ncbi:hypothetical protein [Streptomyces sp. NBC_00582]|uniref:hypothetical protein n=1 Tax=Streptomyces sp. NBC_00582 TaxID=2975783 RepID=UPI001063FDEA|nr:hypothetical protein [Streptomyces sp. NBC_00582]WUB67044.1 hypothetical protein OG852_44905 [Streptomyces sp. NBC_00582]